MKMYRRYGIHILVKNFKSLKYLEAEIEICGKIFMWEI